MKEDLTPAQLKIMDEYRQRWIQSGVATEPCNREAAEHGIREAYRLVEGEPLPAVTEVIWFDSPHAALLEVQKRTGESGFIPCCYGYQDSHWIGFYDYSNEVLNDLESANITGIKEIAQNCGWWWPDQKGLVVASERHSIMALDEDGRPHSKEGPAIGFPDGWGVYMWHGTEVEKRLIAQPETIHPDEIFATDNVEMRRIKMEIFGYERLIQESKARRVREDDYGILWHLPFEDDEPLVMVEVVNTTPEPNGSYRHFFIRVSPSMLEQSPHEAVASTFAGHTAEQYRPNVQT